ncbi:LysR family transcriptional regulator [Terrarubrum flagellatum]|uniref:LysR family transcriptional regulator n=1 Tax=Terrirubrum flagellatum TaxID=2895980 RepID=UPI0031454DA7
MNGPLDPRQLEAFSAVVATGGVTAAAQMLGRSQPAVTRQIQELETTLGFSLLERTGRGVTPTERGRRFHIEVERHLAGLQRLSDRAGAILAGAGASLEIAAIPAFAAGLISEAVAHMPAAGDIAVHLRAVGGEEVVDLVLDRISDLGLCSLPLRSAGLDVHWAVEADCVAVLRTDDPLAREKIVPLQALAGRRLITTANPYRQRRHVDEALRAAGLSRQTPLDTNTSFSAIGAVRAGLGVALIEPLTPAGAPVEGLVTRAIDVSLPFRYGAIMRAGSPPSQLIQELIGALPGFLGERVPGLRKIEIARDELVAEDSPPLEASA